ncbi:MAG: hypothetical protein CMJ65_15610 [Planctomycetaceae bacterium]|nr:hypothetical protein [Planctomycetaceae bacterium]MDP7277271.1 hypothetical protein [Planctomycetaceae bacterium]
MQGVRTVQGRAIPGWIVSVILHGLLLIACAISLRSCQAAPGEGPGEYRDVGLFVKTATTSPRETPAKADPPAPRQDNSPPAEEPRENSTVEQLLALPATTAPAILGPGARMPDSPLANPSRLLTNRSVKGGSPLSGLEKGETRFLGIRDKGTRFVYVLDRSASMFQHHALEVAKAELLTSLQHLDETQHFQVIFYNEATPRLLTLGDRDNAMHRATDINKTLARQHIAGVTPDGGTRHFPALMKALSLGPEVIYFLTDADVNSQITPADLDRLSSRNRGRCRIHAIKFGLGAELAPNHYVKRLATRNGGRYRYRDIKSFSSR